MLVPRSVGRCCTMGKEPEKGRVWDLLSPRLISGLITALFGHFLRNSGGFKHSQVSSYGSQALTAPKCPFLSVLLGNELVLLRSVCLFVTWAPFQLLISQVDF